MITCNQCNGDCCRVLVVEIDAPKTRDDYEDIEWYLFHPGVRVYIDTDNCWNVQFNTKCRYLSDDDKCMIYDKRPPVCRKAMIEECEKNKKEIKECFGNVKEYEDWLKKNKKFT